MVEDHLYLSSNPRVVVLQPCRNLTCLSIMASIRTTPKLRDSCHGCASSKVKCNKEKPTCARCAKRGQTCEYFATKRAGRKHESRPSDASNVSIRPPSSSTTGPATPSDISSLISPSQIHSPSHETAYSYSSNLPSAIFPVESSWPSTMPGMNNEYNPFTTDDTKHTLPELNTNHFFAQDDAFSMEEMQGLPGLFSPPDSRASTTDLTSLSDNRADPTMCCLTRALALLKQLFPNASATCAHSQKNNHEIGSVQLRTVKSVVMENEHTIEALTDMLQCPCSHDGYLLAIMFMVVFKILAWYAVAAREIPTKPSSYMDGEDNERMAGQLILSELHRVQRLMNQLSQRLRRRGGRAVATPNSPSDGQIPILEKESPTAFPDAMLDQLETNLRGRLQSLSLEIVDSLRR